MSPPLFTQACGWLQHLLETLKTYPLAVLQYCAQQQLFVVKTLATVGLFLKELVRHQSD
jgi:hypothetical protein